MRSRTAAVTLLTAVTVGAAVPALASTVSVRVGSFYFEDSSTGDGRVVVAKGDQITFRFEGSTGHTATVAGMFDSSEHSSNETYTTPPLNQVGTFTLYCQIHGAPQHSTRLVITDPAAATPSPSRTPSAAASPKPSPRPSPKPSPKPSPQPTPARTLPAPSPTATHVASSSPSAAGATTSPRSTPTPSATPSSSALPAVSSTAVASAGPTETASPAPAAAGDVVPAAPIDDDGPSWLLPGAILLLLLLLGAGAIAAGRRRQTF